MLIGCSGVQVEEIWSLDDETLQRLRYVVFDDCAVKGILGSSKRCCQSLPSVISKIVQY